MKWIVLLFLLPRLAIADCACETDSGGDCASEVSCSAVTFNALAHALQDAQHDRDLALAANQRLEADLKVALAANQQEPLLQVAFAGTAGLLVGVIAGLLFR